MSFLHNMTIKQKLIAITMLTCLAALLLVGTGYMLWEWTDIHRNMVRRLSTHAELIADNCKAALAFDDSQDAIETLRALHVEHSIVFGCVYNNKREIFATYSPDNTEEIKQPSEFRFDGYYFADGFLTVFKSIVLDKEVIGVVCLRSNLQPMYSMLRHNVLIIISVLILASLTAYIVSSRLQRYISKPIMELADTARIVTDKKDYSTRALSRTNDEVGMLINTFNEMLEQIQQRDSALVKARDDLEERVKLRTTDLTAANEQLTKEIAEREKAEAQQDKLLETIEKTNEELKDFAYIISHDLKAPLRGISTLTEWIINDYMDKLDEDGKEQMKLLSSRVDRMHNLIEGVLQYSRVGRAEEQYVESNLNELVPEVIDMISPPENIEIITENELPTVRCEQTRILQVFQNLLSNAIKYMDKPDGHIKIGCREDNNVWVFSVADNGPGIDEKYFKKIFQIFQTLSARDDFESTGVGLTVTKKIVELYGGKIWVESEPGQGSTFFFTLPKQEMGIRNEKHEANIIS
jgi:signal transduction histidine kinase